MSTLQTEVNPYAPSPSMTAVHGNDKDAAWYLSKVQKYFRRMGIGSLVYMAIAIVVLVATQLMRSAVDIPETVGTLAWCALLAWLFISMVRVGYLSEAEFPLHYQKARWIAIIAGTLFLPILGLPAFISLRRLSKYDSLINAESHS